MKIEVTEKEALLIIKALHKKTKKLQKKLMKIEKKNQ